MGAANHMPSRDLQTTGAGPANLVSWGGGSSRNPKVLVPPRCGIGIIGFTQKRPTPIYEDNTACIEWGDNVIGARERAKHIEIRKHFAHEVIQNGARLIKVPTAQQMADILTKGLHLPQVLACVDGLLHQRHTSST